MEMRSDIEVICYERRVEYDTREASGTRLDGGGTAEKGKPCQDRLPS